MRDAFIRSARTFAQTLAGSLVALPTVDAIADVRQVGEPIIVGLYVAFMAGVVSFLHNVSENVTRTPKG